MPSFPVKRYPQLPRGQLGANTRNSQDTRTPVDPRARGRKEKGTVDLAEWTKGPVGGTDWVIALDHGPMMKHDHG